jgi:predicted metalloprotease
MRWQRSRRSENIEDRRRMRAGPAVVGGGGLGLLILVVVVALLGGDPTALLQQAQQAGPPGGGPEVDAPLTPEELEQQDFVSAILGETEDIWSGQFQDLGRTYRPPTLVLFNGSVDSACGFASAAVGPFYCPADQKVYLDTSFFEELSRRFGAPGDFARAYVIAHEIGHHVQHQLGTMDKVHALQQRVSKAEANALSVRLELQADFYAGVWAHHAQKARKILEPGDIEEGLRAAAAIGDDRLQKEAQGYVVPDAFTHGSSEQRVKWFRKGLESGDISQGDTFSVEDL